jgi:hypothetical protein
VRTMTAEHLEQAYVGWSSYAWTTWDCVLAVGERIPLAMVSCRTATNAERNKTLARVRVSCSESSTMQTDELPHEIVLAVDRVLESASEDNDFSTLAIINDLFPNGPSL